MELGNIPANVLNAVKQRSFYDAQIKAMSAKKLFYEYCEWHGLIGWAPSLWECVTALQAAEQFEKGPAS